MKLRVLPPLLFLIAFQMEVRVRASMQQSEGVSVVRGSAARVQLLPETLFDKKSPAEGRLVQGRVRVVTNEKWVLESVYGEAELGSGEFWALTRANEVLFRAVLGDLEIHLRDGKKFVLPEGLQAWIGGIDAQGRSTHGVPEAIPIKEHLALWSLVHEGDKQSFRAEVLALKERWKTTTESAADMYQKIVDRHVASQREEQLEKSRLLKKKQDEQRALREIYRAKVFER